MPSIEQTSPVSPSPGSRGEGRSGGLALTEEQRSFQLAAREIVREKLPVSHLHHLRDSRDPAGLSRPLWRELAALGWAGALVPEVLGGAGLGLADLGVVLEECGRTLAPTPLLSTSVLGAGALLAGAGDTLRQAHLPALCAGERVFALAFEEQPRFAPHAVATRAHADADGWRLDGAKVNVLDGGAADWLLVTARVAGGDGDRDGLGLFLVPAGAPGMTVEPLRRVDSRGAANLSLAGVHVDESHALGRPGRAAELLDALVDRATAALCAEMLGSAQEAFDRTLAYLKERRQFGVPIGSFQALKHRAARMYCELELTRSIVRASLLAQDTLSPDAPALTSAAKARASDTFLHVASEAIQLHGGIGATDDLDIGFYLKRARTCAMLLGTAAHHRDRYARLHAY